MPFQPGHPRFGGRRGGKPERERQAREAEARTRLAERMKAVLGDVGLDDPASVLAMVMRIAVEEGDRPGALQAASALMPYRYPRLASSEVTVRRELSALSDRELLDEARQIEQRMAALGPLIEALPEPPTEPLQALDPTAPSPAETARPSTGLSDARADVVSEDVG